MPDLESGNHHEFSTFQTRYQNVPRPRGGLHLSRVIDSGRREFYVDSYLRWPRLHLPIVDPRDKTFGTLQDVDGLTVRKHQGGAAYRRSPHHRDVTNSDKTFSRACLDFDKTHPHRSSPC
jgi:hypothetical protein